MCRSGRNDFDQHNRAGRLDAACYIAYSSYVVDREPDVDRERMVGTTTLDAPTGRLVATLLGDAAPERWIDLVAEADDVLTSFALTP